MLRSKTGKRRSAPARARQRITDADRRGNSARRVLRRVRAVLVIALGLSLSSLVPGLAGTASAASPLNVFVGYFDTHTVPFSSNQPNPWPYKDASSFVGTRAPVTRTIRRAGTPVRSGWTIRVAPM